MSENRKPGTQLPYDDPQWVDASLTGDVAGDHGSGFLDGTEDNGATEHSFPISVMRSLPDELKVTRTFI